MKKNYNDFRKTLLRSGFMALGVFTLMSFNDYGPGSKEKEKGTATVQPADTYQVKVNFQDKSSIPPADYLKDYGQEFGANSATTFGNDYKYGWKNAESLEPIDLSDDNSENGPGEPKGVGRNRLKDGYGTATPQQQLEGTLVHFQGDNVLKIDGSQQWLGQPRATEAIWELEVPDDNGAGNTYKVTLSLGDKSSAIDSRYTATVEGISIMPAFVPSPGETREGTIIVKVTDGALTIGGLGAYNAKIDYITVTQSSEAPVVPKTLTFTPDAAAINVAYNGMGTFSTTIAGDGAGNIGLVINDAVNNWFTLPEVNSPSALDIAVSPTDLVVGSSRSNEIIATAAGFKPATFTASFTVGCKPLSLLACADIVLPLPINLNFSTTDGGLPDVNGVNTGFTASPWTSLYRTSEDQDPLTYQEVAGYEPTKLNVSGGNLEVTATKGIDFLDNNRQINTLSVGLQSIAAPIQLETRLLNIVTGSTGSPQAGLNFGFDDDNYIKLVVSDNSIEFRKEIGGKSNNSEDVIRMDDLDISGKNVKLRMILNTNNMTLSGYYAIEDGDFTKLEAATRSSLTLPQALLDGMELSDAVQNVSFAGIFATYNNATESFVAVFDYFNVIEANLSIDSKSLAAGNDIVLYPNPATSKINVRLGQNLDAVKNITIYDIQGRAVSSFEPNTVRKNNGFELPTANLKSGVYFVQLQNKNGANQQVRFIANN